MKKVSVIIPMYNSEAFIKQCLQSVTAQTYYNMEIIIIDDGSVDRSGKICETFGFEDMRIKVLVQEHQGVSSARNYGLDKAVGEYIFFLDSDDIIHPFLIEELVWKLEESRADAAFCTCEKFESSQIDIIMNKLQADNVRGGVEVGEPKELEHWFHKKYIKEMSCIGGKLICRNTIGSLRFDESLHTGEDTVFMYNLVCSQIRMIYYHRGWYYYRRHTKSLIHCDAMEIYEGCFKKYEIIRDAEYQRKHYNTALSWEQYILSEMQRMFQRLKSMDDKEGMRQLQKMMIAERRHPLFVWLESTRAKDFDDKNRNKEF